jgi:hypothetical protein
MLTVTPNMKPLLPRWLRQGRAPAADDLRRRIEGQFLYRGVSTLELRSLSLDGSSLDIGYYARPVYPNDRRIRNRTREAAFADQLFQDAVTVLDTVWKSTEDVDSVLLGVWMRLDSSGQESPLLQTNATRERAKALASRRRLAPFEILRCFSTHTRIDRRGNIHDVRLLG